MVSENRPASFEGGALGPQRGPPRRRLGGDRAQCDVHRRDDRRLRRLQPLHGSVQRGRRLTGSRHDRVDQDGVPAAGRCGGACVSLGSRASRRLAPGRCRARPPRRGRRRAAPVRRRDARRCLGGDGDPERQRICEPATRTAITATFADDGTLVGSAGCNTYRSTFTTDRGGIEIAPPAATRKTCATPDGVMVQEAAYLASLPTAACFRVDGGSLALLRADGTYVASYARVARR